VFSHGWHREEGTNTQELKLSLLARWDTGGQQIQVVIKSVRGSLSLAVLQHCRCCLLCGLVLRWVSRRLEKAGASTFKRLLGNSGLEDERVVAFHRMTLRSSACLFWCHAMGVYTISFGQMANVVTHVLRVNGEPESVEHLYAWTLLWIKAGGPFNKKIHWGYSLFFFENPVGGIVLLHHLS
jgi:hypothetical protein